MEWQYIETAPTDGTTILGWWINGEQHTGSICDGRWIPAWEHQDDGWDMPSLWMPLAEPDDAMTKEALSRLLKRPTDTGSVT